MARMNSIVLATALLAGIVGASSAINAEPGQWATAASAASIQVLHHDCTPESSWSAHTQSGTFSARFGVHHAVTNVIFLWDAVKKLPFGKGCGRHGCLDKDAIL